jgi:hypothetical protein
MFEAKPTAGGSGWPQLGAQLPPRGDVTLRSDRIGFGDCLVCIRARARAPVAAVAPATQKAQGHRKRPESQADANNALTRHCQLRVPSQLLSPEIGSAGVLKLESAVQLGSPFPRPRAHSNPIRECRRQAVTSCRMLSGAFFSRACSLGHTLLYIARSGAGRHGLRDQARRLPDYRAQDVSLLSRGALRVTLTERDVSHKESIRGG